MSRQLAAAALIAAFALTGCGAQKASLVAASVPSRTVPANAGVIAASQAGIVANNAARVAPSVDVIPGAARLHSSLRLVGHAAMADDELAEDAESQGYSIFAADHAKPFNKTGFVRKTETGFMLEGQKGGFMGLGKKEKDNYVLIAGSPAISQALVGRVNTKALIKGLVDKDNNVTVTSVKGLADLGFLTNWFSKGKIVGTIVEAGSKKPLAGVTVSAKSEDGFVFKVTTEGDGEFAIKSLTPGKYKMQAWSERSKAPVTQDIVIKAGANEVSASLEAGAAGSTDKFGAPRGQSP